MKAIILSAGRGSRLLPCTTDIPKCLVPVDGDRPLLDVQLSTLAACGVDEVVIMVGFEARRVEEHLSRNPVAGINVRTLYNPFYNVADNLITCWLARDEMNEPFILLNGDTLFEPMVLETLLATAIAPLTLAVKEEAKYDADDMKVCLQGHMLTAVGKDLDVDTVDAESIGLMMFRGDGPKRFQVALAHAVRCPFAFSAWYLSVVDTFAQYTRVETVSVSGFWTAEVDSLQDLAQVRAALDPADPWAVPLGNAERLRATG
jgi:choline kinase